MGGSPIDKGIVRQFTLDKTALAAAPKVAASGYYSSPSIWKTVELNYKTDYGNQIKTIVFDATQALPSADVLVSITQIGTLIFESLIIHDFDNGFLSLERADITVAQFDMLINLGIAPAAAVATVTNFSTVVLATGQGANYKAGYNVVAFDGTVNRNGEVREILSVTGDTITLVSPFTSIVIGDLLRFPNRSSASPEQLAKFQFIA